MNDYIFENFEFSQNDLDYQKEKMNVLVRDILALHAVTERLYLAM